MQQIAEAGRRRRVAPVVRRVKPGRTKEGITDCAPAEQEQERLRQWQKMEALGTMAGGIAHDFNNMLLPILINAELALGDEDPDVPNARRLQQIIEAAKRGRDMVKQIIMFAQEKEIERGPVQVYPVVRDALKLLRATLPKNV